MLRSLKLRLFLLGGLAIAAALAVTAVVMGYQFEAHLKRKLASDLKHQATALVGSARLDEAGVPVIDHLPVDPRFSTPGGGAYWTVRTSAGSAQSESLWDADLPIAPNAPRDEWRQTIVPGPFEHDVLLLERTMRLGQHGPDMLVQIAQDEDPLDDAAAEFRNELIYFLLLLWLFLVGAAWVQVTVGLRPLGKLSDELRGMRRAPGRRLGKDHPVEIRALTEAIDALADARQEDVRRARNRAADLAHALKTPFAAIAAQSRAARKAGDGDALDGIERALATASAALDAELARASALSHRQSSSDPMCRPLEQVEALFSVISRTEKGAMLVYEAEIDPAFTLPIEGQVFTELLGNLLDNATGYARRRVVVRGWTEGALNHVSVDDDGPGIAPDLRDRMLARGIRNDQRGSGHGLGLAIVRDLVEATEGSLKLATSQLGGLAVVMCWAEAGDGNM